MSSRSVARARPIGEQYMCTTVVDVDGSGNAVPHHTHCQSVLQTCLKEQELEAELATDGSTSLTTVDVAVLFKSVASTPDQMINYICTKLAINETTLDRLCVSARDTTRESIGARHHSMKAFRNSVAISPDFSPLWNAARNVLTGTVRKLTPFFKWAAMTMVALKTMSTTSLVILAMVWIVGHVAAADARATMSNQTTTFRKCLAWFFQSDPKNIPIPGAKYAVQYLAHNMYRITGITQAKRREEMQKNADTATTKQNRLMDRLQVDIQAAQTRVIEQFRSNMKHQQDQERKLHGLKYENLKVHGY